MSLAWWSHSDSIPNSAVKHLSGHDTCGVAHWDNSSMPEFIFPSSHPRKKDGLVFFY
ncbi:hypothetical protein CY0110_19177 [Crocosphaera chwakensis CCY0110]|uniref:Uncharacterized protein n=1 Tax=Crocosphaera chwakensis CCY0110 TaxID=391612 RepID=A3IJG7_9CHRO|nr:hypothetical protein CY0110_19177 [Crocosphaera chwakensis CCY0110]